ncbi:MAG: ATP-binding protein [Verrucomicrobiae bacterium]
MKNSHSRMDASADAVSVGAPDFRISGKGNGELFRTVAEFTYDWEYWVGNDGRMIYISPSCERISGYAREEFFSNNHLVQEIVHPEDQRKFSGHVREVRQTDLLDRQGGRSDSCGLDGSKGVDFRIIKKDGSLAYIEHKCQPVFDERGAYQGRRVSNRDVTDRMLAEASMRESEAKLRAILESTADGLLAVDNAGKVAHANARFVELWRIPWNLMSDGHDKDLLDYVLAQLADPDVFLNKVKELYNSDARSMDTLAFKDGRVYERYSLPMITDGVRIGRVWSFRDVTKSRRDQNELLLKNAEIERFASAVSHDLKSPVVTIKAFLRYLEQDLEARNAGAVASDLRYIRGAADKMECLLDELLHLVRVGHIRTAAEEIPLQEIVREALDLVAGQIAERGVHVEVTRLAARLYGDRPRLVEVFQNLIDNAVKFLGGQPSPQIEIGAEVEAGDIVLFVRDNGIGIDPRHQAKLFGLFEKLDPHAPGFGIGLATVSRIVKAHGGQIRVESKGPGTGATFRFTLANTELIPK